MKIDIWPSVMYGVPKGTLNPRRLNNLLALQAASNFYNDSRGGYLRSSYLKEARVSGLNVLRGGRRVHGSL